MSLKNIKKCPSTSISPRSLGAAVLHHWQMMISFTESDFVIFYVIDMQVVVSLMIFFFFLFLRSLIGELAFRCRCC